MSNRRYPILGAGFSIPWEMIEPYERQARENHDQTLEELARRGGTDSIETLCILHGIGWDQADWPDPRPVLLHLMSEWLTQHPRQDLVPRVELDKANAAIRVLTDLNLDHLRLIATQAKEICALKELVGGRKVDFKEWE